MAYNDKTKQYVYEYKAKNIKRVPFDLQLSEYEELKQAAAAAGMSVNGFIKYTLRAAGAISERAGVAAAVPVGCSGGAAAGGVTPSDNQG